MAAKKKGKRPQVEKKRPSKGREERAALSGIMLLSPANVKTFMQEVQAEFKKVVWPDRKVTLGLTGFVLVLTFFFAIYLGSVDFILGKIITSVLK